MINKHFFKCNFGTSTVTKQQLRNLLRAWRFLLQKIDWNGANASNKTENRGQKSNLLIPGRRPGFRSADDPFKLSLSRLPTTYDSQSSPAKVKKQLCGCRNSPKRCITGLVCIMSFQKKIHIEKILINFFFDKNIYSKKKFWVKKHLMLYFFLEWHYTY